MKKIVASMMLGTMIISSASMSFANAKPMEKIVLAQSATSAYEMDASDLEDCELLDIENMTFADFMGDDLKAVSSTDKDLMEKHFTEAIKLEKAEKYEDAEKEWEAFDKVFFKYEKELYGDEKMPTFSDFMKDMKDILKPVDTKTEKALKAKYDQAVKLEEDKKYDEAMKVWEDFYTEFDKLVDPAKVEECTTCDFDEDEFDGDGDYQMPDYKTYMKDISEILKPIADKDQKAMEALYNKALANEKEGKFDEADKDWEAFDKIFNKYLKAELLEETKTQ